VSKGNGVVLVKTLLKIHLRNWNVIFDQVNKCCIVGEEAGALSCLVIFLYT
jgi:hypothetical protein